MLEIYNILIQVSSTLLAGILIFFTLIMSIREFTLETRRRAEGYKSVARLEVDYKEREGKAYICLIMIIVCLSLTLTFSLAPLMFNWLDNFTYYGINLYASLSYLFLIISLIFILLLSKHLYMLVSVVK